MKSGYIYKKLYKCFKFESLKLRKGLNNQLPISNTGSSLQECPNHFKIDMHVKESCHCLFLQIVDFYLIRYGDTAMQSKVHVSRSNRSPTRENRSGSRTEKGAFEIGS